MKKNKTRDIERIINAKCEFHTSDGFKEEIMAKANQEAKTHPQHIAVTSRSVWRIAFSGLALIAILTTLMLAKPGTIPAYAAEKLFAKASEYFSNIGGYKLSIKVRTGEDENFSYTNPADSFIDHKMTVAEDGRWRLDKAGRSAEFDGENVWVWFPEKYWGWKMDEGSQSGVLEHFLPLLNLKGLMSFIESYAASRDDINIRKKEKDGKILLSMKAPALGNFTNGHSRNSSILESDTRQTYVFDSASGRLESLNIDVLVFGFIPRTILKLEEIQYDSRMAGSISGLPSGIEWIDKTEEGLAAKASNLPFHEFKGISAREAAIKMVAAMKDWDKERLSVILGDYPLSLLEKRYSGSKLIECGEPFTSGTYAGVFVPCEVQYADGNREKLKIALRNDNRYGIWSVDGGI